MIRTIITYALIGIPICIAAVSLFELYFRLDLSLVFALIVTYALTSEIYRHFFDPYVTVFCPECKQKYRLPRRKAPDSRYVCRNCGHLFE